MGIEEVLSAPHSPWQRAYVERVIGSIRRECLDHVIVFDEASLRRTLATYFDYYHRSRTHLALRKDAPEPRPAASRDRTRRLNPTGRRPAPPLRTPRRVKQIKALSDHTEDARLPVFAFTVALWTLRSEVERSPTIPWTHISFAGRLTCLENCHYLHSRHPRKNKQRLSQ